MKPFQIQDLLMKPVLWKFVGFVSSLVGLLCYALSSSFKHLFGEWNLLKILVYAGLSFTICSIMLFAKKWQLSKSFLLKAHMGFLVLMLTSMYSFFSDKALNGKPNVLSLVSSGAFALMSLSLSRQIQIGFEVGVFNYFSGGLTVQLMQINLFLAFVAAVFCYSLIVLRSYLDSHLEIGSVRNEDHVALEINSTSGVERGSDNDNRQESKTLRRRRNVTQGMQQQQRQGGGDSGGWEEEPLLSDSAPLITVLSSVLLLGDRLTKTAQEAESSNLECSELAKQVETLSNMLRSIIRLASITPSLYEQPIRRIVADVFKNLERALTLVRKCKKYSGVLRQVFSNTSTDDFRKVSNLLESSIGDMKWLLSIFDSDGTNPSPPLIASNDPILARIWSYIFTIQMGQLKDRAEAANELASIAKDNDRNKIIIMEEGGILPLLKLLEKNALPDAQIAAANALVTIATDQERVVEFIVESLGVPIIVHVLGDWRLRVQVSVANLVSKMAEHSPFAQELFVSANVTKPLISLLSTDTALGDHMLQAGRASIHSLVSNLSSSGRSSFSANSDHGSGRGGHYRKEREVESFELKNKIKITCSEALWKLSKGCRSTCKKITSSKGLLCLAKMVETERGELQLNCLMAIMEIAAVAESNADLRRVAFKPTAPATKAVLDQLLRVIKDESNPSLQIPAIKSIGSLSRKFPGKVPQILGPLVAQLGNKNVDVAIEAAIALGKFVSPDNFNCVDHSKAIMEFDVIPSLMRLLQITDRAQKHGLVLLCYLALNVGNSKALEQARALSTLEGLARPVVAQHPELRELFEKANHHLTLYQTEDQSPRQPYAP